MRLLRVLSNPAFGAIWFVGFLSAGSLQITRIALLLHVADCRGAVPDVALLVLLETLPGAVAAPLAGALTDRTDKCTALVATATVQATLIVVLLAAPTYAVICLVTASQSVVTMFFHSLRAAALPSLLSRNGLPEANGLEQSAISIAMVAGPIIGANLPFYICLSIALVGSAISIPMAAS